MTSTTRPNQLEEDLSQLDQKGKTDYVFGLYAPCVDTPVIRALVLKEPLLSIPICSNQDPHGYPSAHNQPHQRPVSASLHRNFPRNSPNRQDCSFKDYPDGV